MESMDIACKKSNVLEGKTGRSQGTVPGRQAGTCVQLEGDRRDCPGRLVEDIQEIKEAITQVKEQGEEWHTNFYVADDRLSFWISAGQIRMRQTGSTLLIFRQRPMQWQMYVCNTAGETLASDLAECLLGVEGNISTDILGQDEALAEALPANGFRRYMLLHRITQTYPEPTPPVEPFDDKWLAGEEDLPGIMEILYENMDPRCEQLPDPEEFLQDIRNRNVLAIHAEESRELAAFLSFHRKGKLLHWEYWVSRKKYRKEKLGLKLYAPYMQLNWDARRQIGFVRDDNPMIEVYEYMGFRKDGLKDEVFVRDGKDID